VGENLSLLPTVQYRLHKTLAIMPSKVVYLSTIPKDCGSQQVEILFPVLQAGCFLKNLEEESMGASEISHELR
jgi:hypothetical protein